MKHVTRRDVLRWAALAPVVPTLLAQRVNAAAMRADRHDGRVVVVVRMMGGNDGLNAVIPVRDDRYYRARPTIAIARQDTIALGGSDFALHSSLARFHDLMQAGNAGIVQGVGYPASSRSHLRATEIWETGSVTEPAPAHGWLGRYLDGACDCGPASAAGVQLGDVAGRTLASASRAGRQIGHPDLLLQMNADALERSLRAGPASAAFESLAENQRALAAATRQVHRASRGSGRKFDYPDTAFGAALRWVGNMVETECPTRAYALTVGSFENDAPSFDTHIDQLPKHEILYSELSRSLHAFTTHLGSAGQLERVLVMTYSDFGRQLSENRTRGTEHGDASVLFYAGGRVEPGLRGRPPDLADVRDGGLRHRVDFRGVYTDVLANWLRVDATGLLGGEFERYAIVRAG